MVERLTLTVMVYGGSPALALGRIELHRARGRNRQSREAEVWTFDRLENIGGHKTTVLGEPKIIDSPMGKAVEFDGVDDALFIDNHPLAGTDRVHVRSHLPAGRRAARTALVSLERARPGDRR